MSAIVFSKWKSSPKCKVCRKTNTDLHLVDTYTMGEKKKVNLLNALKLQE